MIKKIYKLFGLKILEIETSYGDKEERIYKPKKFRKPVGEVLTYSPEEEAKDRERETEQAMER